MTHQLKHALLLTPAITASLFGGMAQAHEKGDIILRAGAVMVEPRESSSNVNIDSPGLGAVNGAKVGVDNNIQLGLTGTYMLTDQLGIGVLAATPFKHDVMATDAIAGVGKLAETKHLPPTLTAQYHFTIPDSKLSPYVGAGINYTLFFQEKTTDALTGAVGALASLAENSTPGVTATSTTLHLEDSVGAALELGLDYQINDNLGINASYWYIDIETDAEIVAQTNVGEVKASTTVSIDPHVYFVGLSYKF